MAVDEAAIALSRRRSVLAAAAPLLLAFLAVLVFGLLGDAGRRPVWSTLLNVSLACSVFSLGPLAAGERIFFGLAPGLMVLSAVVGWIAWILLIWRTRLGDAPPLVHLLATGIWLAIGFALVMSHALDT